MQLIKFLFYQVVLLLLINNLSLAQVYQLKGKIRNKYNEPLAYVNVYVANSKIITKSNGEGNFVLYLNPGKNELVFNLAGYKEEKKIIIQNDSITIFNILMQEDAKILEDVTMISRRKDFAIELVKNVIASKDNWHQKQNQYHVEAYIKSYTWKLASALDSLKKIKTTQKILGVKETELLIDKLYPNKLKEIRNAVKESGNNEYSFFNRSTDAEFDFTKNLVQLPLLTQLPILSPFSYSGLIAYKHKTLRQYKIGNYNYYQIKVSPTKMGNSLIEGEFLITDDGWSIVEYEITIPKHLMASYDYFNIAQKNLKIDSFGYLPQTQILNYRIKSNGGNINGKTEILYINYNLDTIFAKKHFGDMVSETLDSAFFRSNDFWNITRPIVLTEDQVIFIKKQDSIKEITTSKRYLDSVDKKTNKITLKNIFIDGQTIQNHEKGTKHYFLPIPSIVQFGSFGGTRLGYGHNFFKEFKNKKNININWNLNRGIRNKDFKGDINFTKRYNPYKDGFITIGIENNFKSIFSDNSWNNAINRNSIFEEKRLFVNHRIEIFNGFEISNKFEIARRSSVEKYKLNSKIFGWLSNAYDSSLFQDYAPVAFPTNNTFYNEIGIYYTPHQKFIKEPFQKIILGSRWPTFFLKVRSALPNIFNSIGNFTSLEYGAFQKINFGLYGEANWNLTSGSFIGKKNIPRVDSNWIAAGQPLFFANPKNSFQALENTVSLLKPHLKGHYYHEFRGAFINKIPYVKHLGLSEIAGGGFLIAPEKNINYYEAYFGLEKLIRVLSFRAKLGLYSVFTNNTLASNFYNIKFAIRPFNRKTNSFF